MSESEEEEEFQKVDSRYLTDDSPEPATTKSSKPRMAMLEGSLTDCHTVKCLESELVDQVETFAPGMLLALLSPLEVRRGVCMLQKANIKTLYDPSVDD